MRVLKIPFRLFLAALLVLGAAGCTDQLTSTGAVESNSDPVSSLDELVKQAEATAHVQILHNADDPKARVVDVYVNDVDNSETGFMLALDNFKYRTATEFIELPVGLEVAVAPVNSRSADDAIATFDFDLTADEKYAVVADGVLNSDAFEGNPDGQPIGLNLYPFAPAQTEASESGMVDVLAFHGATDAPTVDVVARQPNMSTGGTTVVDDIMYGTFQGYASVAPAKYVLDVKTADGSTTVASFTADLSELSGSAITVVASGFFTPPKGPVFGLLAVLPDGSVITLPRMDDDGDDDDGEDAQAYEAELSGENEVPSVETEAEGEAKFQFISATNELRYEIKLEDIENVTQAHIHLGGPDENGPVVAFLLQFTENVDGSGEGEPVTPRGTLVEQGVITADDVIARAGEGFDGSLQALISEINAGNTYVNVHTTQNPAGEIRGQIEPEGDAE